jgi:hypothetical protein
MPLFGVALAPLFRSLSLLNQPLNAFNYCFPWCQLEQLELLGCNQRLSTVEWLLLMDECLNLTLCHVTISSVTPMAQFQEEIIMPSLRYLHINSCGTSLLHMYQSLWCLMLEGLIVEYDPEYEIDFDEAPEEFGAFIEGSPALLAFISKSWANYMGLSHSTVVLCRSHSHP